MSVFSYTMFSVWLLALLAASCSTPQRMARKCNDLFPPAPDSIVVKQDTIHDTIELAPYVHFDTIPCPPGDTAKNIFIKIEVPGKKIPFHKVKLDTTFYKNTSGANIEALKFDVLACESEKKELQKDVVKWKLKAAERKGGGWFWAFWILLTSVVAHSVFRIISSLNKLR